MQLVGRRVVDRTAQQCVRRALGQSTSTLAPLLGRTHSSPSRSSSTMPYQYLETIAFDAMVVLVVALYAASLRNGHQ